MDIQKALKVVKNMNREEIDSMIYYLEFYGWYREDKRKRRAFVNDVIKNNWHIENSRNQTIKAIRNSAE